MALSSSVHLLCPAHPGNDEARALTAGGRLPAAVAAAA